MKYQDQLQQTLDAANTQTFEGILLDSVFDEFVVILPCFCVHDSNDSPCCCMENNRILIPKGEIIGDISKVPNTSKTGKDLSKIVVNRDTQVIFERSDAMRADAASTAARGHPVGAWNPLPLSCPWLPATTGPTKPIPDPEDPDVLNFGIGIGVGITGFLIAYGIAKLIEDDETLDDEIQEVIDKLRKQQKGSA